MGQFEPRENYRRMKLAHEISAKAFNAAADVIDSESTDLGIALAACEMVKGHVSSYVDAVLLLDNKRLQDITAE